MKIKLGLLLVLVVTISMVGNASAHKSEVVGDYKIEVGWKNEPPVVGQKNAIEIIVTVATQYDKESHESEEHDEEHDESIEHEGMTHEEHEEEMEMMKEEEHDDHEEEMDNEEHLEPGTAVSGLSEKLEATVNLQGKKTPLVLTESSKGGVYHSDYTPAAVGFPSVNLVGEIGHKEFEMTFHPEKVEEISILSPIKQLGLNIAPSNVECKSEMVLVINNYDGRPACVSSSGAEKLEALGWGTRA